uniref:Uncharacterized protein n=1 Tax=Anguilla anguilla TaxID=7936 RepID=A0A0E9XET5_ANGAN
MWLGVRKRHSGFSNQNQALSAQAGKTAEVSCDANQKYQFFPSSLAPKVFFLNGGAHEAGSDQTNHLPLLEKWQ